MGKGSQVSFSQQAKDPCLRVLEQARGEGHTLKIFLGVHSSLKHIYLAMLHESSEARTCYHACEPANDARAFLGLRAQSAACGSSQIQPIQSRQEGIRLGFFECHVCLIPRKQTDEQPGSQVQRAAQGCQLAPGSSAELYRLCASSAPPTLRQSCLNKALTTSHNGTFLFLHPPGGIAAKQQSSCSNEVDNRFWRVTSVTYPLQYACKAEVEESNKSNENQEESQPWDGVLRRVARWLVADRLSATVLILGGNRAWKSNGMHGSTNYASPSKDKGQRRWRPCIAQRVCAHAFAVARFQGNPCKKQLFAASNNWLRSATLQVTSCSQI